jgi:FlaA1/EpsC-like NDP-sugar epimerase
MHFLKDAYWFVSQNFFTLTYRNFARLAIDALILVLAYFLAFDIRLDYQLESRYLQLMYATTLEVVSLTLLFLIGMRNYQRFWRFFSGKDMLILIAALGMAVVFFSVFPRQNNGLTLPLSIISIYGLVAFLLLLGTRALYRYVFSGQYLRGFIHRGERKNLLIIGAGNGGELLVRQIQEGKIEGYRPIAFVDDDKQKLHQKIHGIQVIGGLADLKKIVAKKRIEIIIIAAPSASAEEMRAIVTQAQQTGIAYKTLPSLSDLKVKDSLAEQIRDVKIEDLLDRETIRSDLKALALSISNKTVLVTGAAGSIGSELTRQILQLKPHLLIVLDRYENGLFYLDKELAATKTESRYDIVVADIRDSVKMSRVFAKYRPDIVFHAAAYKHVPLMEQFPEEAISNNVLGTHNLAQLADECEVDKFVFISTDKAVNPTSVMGASKRMAELLLRSFSGQAHHTNFINVRFGNVLGSYGSVLPLFKKQIANGGPITITHPEMKRFFMTIPEAVRLILEAGHMGSCGETYILNMGNLVKIEDFARQLIRLSGLEPDRDIAISYTGIRPGEKLYEELWLETEKPEATPHPKISKAIGNGIIAWPDMAYQLDAFRTIAKSADRDEIIAKLAEIIPEYESPVIPSPADLHR